MCTYENDLESPVWMQKDIEPSNEEEKGQTRELSEDFRKNGKEENVRQRITSKTKPKKHTSEAESGNVSGRRPSLRLPRRPSKNI